MVKGEMGLAEVGGGDGGVDCQESESAQGGVKGKGGGDSGNPGWIEYQ